MLHWILTSYNTKLPSFEHVKIASILGIAMLNNYYYPLLSQLSLATITYSRRKKKCYPHHPFVYHISHLPIS